MKKIILNVLSVLIVCGICNSPPAAAAAAPAENIVFVCDISGSMASLDKDGKMISFLQLAAGLNINRGVNIGYITFNEEIVTSIGISPITDFNIESTKTQLAGNHYTKILTSASVSRRQSACWKMPWTGQKAGSSSCRTRRLGW